MDTPARRLMSAYQFVTSYPGQEATLTDLRLQMNGPGHDEGAVGDLGMGPEVLDPLLRQLNGTVVEFSVFDGRWILEGTLRLHTAYAPDFRELDGGVEIGDTLYTRMTVVPTLALVTEELHSLGYDA